MSENLEINNSRVFKYTYNGWKATIKLDREGNPSYVEFASTFDSYKRTKNDSDFDKAFKSVMKTMIKSPKKFREIRNSLSGKYYEIAETIRISAKAKAEAKAAKLMKKYDF